MTDVRFYVQWPNGRRSQSMVNGGEALKLATETGGKVRSFVDCYHYGKK